MTEKKAFAISDLLHRPEFCGAVADRIWRAWWQPEGYPLGHVAGLVQENLTTSTIPFSLVAHVGGEFLGTASIIASDLEERPDYTPWVAAVWVEPDRRSQGIGAALVRAAGQATFDKGFALAYLCALPEKRAFYENMGWQRLEEDVGRHRLTVLTLGTAS